MATKNFIAAIELGSSKIAGIAGCKQADGSVNVLAYAAEESRSFIRKGLIFNIDKAKLALNAVIRNLEEQLGCSIAKVYVGIGGQSLRTVPNEIHRDVIGEEKISQTLIDGLCDDNRGYPIEDMDILDSEPQEYDVDGRLVADPVGVTGTHVTAHFLNVVARSSMRRNLVQAFNDAEVEYADIFIVSRALANSVLTEAELRAGCSLVDIGAETTTVAVYKNNLLRYLAVLPLGSAAITRDLTTLGIEESEAESIKLNHGNAFISVEEDEAEAPDLTLLDGRKVKQMGVDEIVESRANEILANVWNQIQLSGYKDKLLQGVVFTGGGSNLAGIEDAFRKISRIAKIRKTGAPRYALTGIPFTPAVDGMGYALLGMVCMGNENCYKPAEPKIQPEEPKELFDDDLEFKENQKEAARKEREEREKREEEHRRKSDGTKQGSNEPGGNKLKEWWKEKSGAFVNSIFSDDDMSNDFN